MPVIVRTIKIMTRNLERERKELMGTRARHIVRQAIPKILKALLPRTSLRAREGESAIKTAPIAVESSGMEVIAARKIKPTQRSLRP
jgi:hypothetical protein